MNTQLDCSVKVCAHNSTGKCMLTDIKIDGHRADSSSDTCCTSFKPLGSQAKNSTMDKTPTDYAKIRCDAKNCMHNSFGNCAASSIQVENCACSDTTGDCSCTQCSTFSV